MKLALKLAWEHRASWLAVVVLTAVSALVFILSFHVNEGYLIVSPEFAGLNLDVMIAGMTTFLVVQSIAALCLESQARDLAVIKTCGASTKSLRWTLIAEVVLVTIVGYAVGFVASMFVRDQFVHQNILTMIEKDLPNIGFQAGAYISALFWLLVAVVLGAWGTAKRVSRQNVVEALQGETVTTKKRSKALRIIFAILSLLVMIGAFIIVNVIDKILKWAQEIEAPKEIMLQIAGTPMMAAVVFCLAALVFLTAIAPNLYQAILSFITKRFPKSVNAPVQVGFNLARFNAAKYSGSITPIIAFITVVIMIFTATDSSVQPIMAQAQQMGIDTTEMTTTNYSSVAFLIGPAVVIAIVGSLCTIMMSGRNRIYVNKLSGVLGADSKTRLLQGLAEMLGYMLLASIITLVIMLLTGLISMMGNANATQTSIPFVVSWLPWLVALVIAFVVISLPAFYASYRAKQLDSKEILETFGE